MASKDNKLTPLEIETESMKFIESKVDLSRFSQAEIPVVKRIIHATGDLDIGKDVIFTPGAVHKGIQALKNGRDIITDVNMLKTGIDKKRLSHLGGEVHCRIDQKDIHSKAKDTGTTRAASAIYSFDEFISNQVVAIGNAPTALYALLDMVEEYIVPALIIGVPVGFIDAKESKEALQEMEIPYITIKGYKGGSPVASAVINAILRQAHE